MPQKRKQPFLSTQGRRKHPRLNPHLQRGDEKAGFPTDLSDPSSLNPQAIELARKAVEEKIEHGNKFVFRGLKKAKGFEKQKLVKRLKIARGKNEDGTVKKLELEFEVLKTEEIDLNTLASNHILKTLQKYKLISTSALFPPWLASRKELEVQMNDREIAKRNIITRLYNSSAVKESVAAVIKNVKSVMGISEGGTEGGTEGKRKAIEIATNMEPESGEGSGEAVEAMRLVKKMKIGNGSAAEEESRSEGEEEEWGGISNPEESTDVEIDLDAFAADFMDRVAGSSDEDEDQGPLQRGTDDEWSGGDDEEDDEEGQEGGDEYQEEQPQHAKPTASRSGPERKSSSNAKNQTQEVTNSKAKKSERLKSVSSVKSTFLPTLMSGYISGSDSDIDADYYKDKTGKKKGPAQPKERKNRMGQQARRALWQKKFGTEANHIKKEEQEKGRKKIEQRIKQGSGGKPEKKGQLTEVEGPLHPSWEAARRAKEQQAKVQEAVKGKPMGKKIVFD